MKRALLAIMFAAAIVPAHAQRLCPGCTYMIPAPDIEPLPPINGYGYNGALPLPPMTPEDIVPPMPDLPMPGLPPMPFDNDE